MENQPQKKSNKALIIVLSIVGGLVLLGVIGALIINSIFKTAGSIIDDSKNIIDNGSDIANQIIEEGKKQQEKIANMNSTIFEYEDGTFTIKIIGDKSSEDEPATNQKLYVNNKQVTSYVGTGNDEFYVEKVNGVYFLVAYALKAEVMTQNAYIFNSNGNLIKTLPKEETAKPSNFTYVEFMYNDTGFIMVTRPGSTSDITDTEVVEMTFYYDIDSTGNIVFNHVNQEYNT